MQLKGLWSVGAPLLDYLNPVIIGSWTHIPRGAFYS